MAKIVSDGETPRSQSQMESDGRYIEKATTSTFGATNGLG